MAAISIMEDVNFQRKAAEDARKQTEMIIKDLENEIAHRQRIEQRLRENESNLKQAILAADSANQAKSVFLSNMSHELRTPLNAILGFSEIMSHDQVLNAQQREKIRIINHSGEHLLSMINDVLDLSKIESGQMTVKTITFDLHQMLTDLEAMMKVRAEAKDLRFEVEMNHGLCQYIHTDIGKLRQILINLLGNAVKFTNQGGISLRATSQLMQDETTKAMLILEVEDSGIGIPENKLGEIFIPFIQAGRSDRPREGTGLGLAISKSLTALLNGELTVDSTLDKGSIFTVKIPVELSEKSEANIEARERKPVVLGLAEGEPEWRILIVDDNADNLQLLKMLLSHAGFIIKEAYDGQQAIDTFRQWHPHFIWMDMRMPNIDGYEATRTIRSLPGGKDVKIVAITASAFQERKSRILDAGCDDIVRKPYRSHEIFDALHKELGVNFIYDTQREPEVVSIKNLTAEWLEKLPEETRQALLASAKELDSGSVLKIISDEKYFPDEIQEDFKTLVRSFRFDTILNLLSRPTDNTEG
jgi:signal transduction histidine kinase/DNA-binding response OmpR family regulator